MYFREYETKFKEFIKNLFHDITIFRSCTSYHDLNDKQKKVDPMHSGMKIKHLNHYEWSSLKPIITFLKTNTQCDELFEIGKP